METGDTIDKIDRLSWQEETLCQQLEQIFPNHDQLVIRRTVLTARGPVSPIESSLERCIEELVNISPADQKKCTGNRSKETDVKVLSPVQSDVIGDLKQIFPNYDMKIIRRAVCHPSNLFEPLAKPTLLQRCIDDLLDRRTALEVDIDADLDYEDVLEDDKDIEVPDLENTLPKFAVVTEGYHNTLNDEVSVTKVEEPKDLTLTGTEKAMDIVVSDEEELPSAEQIIDAIIDEITESSATKQPQHIINITDLSDNYLDRKSNQTAPVVKPKMKTGLTTATAHISLSESPMANKTKSEKEVRSDKQNDINKQIDKQTSDMSFNSSMADIFSCRTIDFSDSDMSQSSTGSLDSQQDEDDLPQITYPKKIHIRQSEIMNTPRAARDVKLETLATNGDVATTFPTQVGSQSHDKGSPTKVKIEPSKFIFTSDSNQLTSHQVKNGTVFPCVNSKQVPGQKEGIDAPFESRSTSNNVPSSTSRWTPIVSKSVPSSWIPPRSSGNQQTVTIESTHKIIYNNPVPDNVIGHNHFGNNTQYGGARPKYSAPAQNITVKLPLDPPQLQFMDTSRAPSPPRAGGSVVNRGKYPSSSATLSKASDDYLNNEQTTLPASKPKPVLRPPVLFNHSTVRAADSTAAEFRTVPSVVKPKIATTGAQAHVPGGAIRKIPSHTEPYHRDNQPTDPIIIRHEPVDLELEQRDLGLIVIPEDQVDSQRVVQPAPQVLEIPDDPVIQVKKDVLNLFPDVDHAHLDTLCQQHTGHMAVNNICLLLLESKYPKNTDKSTSSEKKTNIPEMVQSIDYYKDYQSVVISETVIIKYQAQAFQILAQEFLWLSANDIKSVMKKVKHFYAPSYKILQTVWHQAVEIAQKKQTEHSPLVFKGLVFQAKIPAEQAGGIEYRMSLKLLKNRRPVIKTHFSVIEELQKEIDFVKQKLKDTETEADHKVAVALNEQEYEDLGQCIECGCCYGEYPFEQMVQCYEGHLFCENCLRQYAKESVFGQGKADLLCMTELCDSAFPKSQLMKALPLEILAKYEDRVTEENLNLADLGDLVKCPHCEFRAFMDVADKVFRCQSEQCKKESCRYCQVEWEEHFGKKCSEVEKKDETKLRLEYEEKMTKAKVRVCHRCKAQFMKLDGCNKMTCRCGAKMCYICRQPNIDYNHFCRHPRDPGKECTQCKACNLWTNPEEDDNRAILEMQKEAEEERKKKGYTEAKVIGVPDQPPTKKIKR